ncbi:MAG: glycosyltransferase family 39 protein [Cyanobacteria bacterium P01_D01_bin.105]
MTSLKITGSTTDTPAEKGTQQDALLDCVLLIGWAGLIIACTSLHPSLMAYDEGNYGAESRFMLDSGQWLVGLWWGEPVYRHGVLLNWLMVLGYKLFGVGDRIVRIWSPIACIAALLCTYDISKIITGRRFLGFLTAALLMLFHLWFKFAHLGTQDMLLVSLELFGIWALLKAETQPAKKIPLGFCTGIVLGLGFLTKTFMIFLPAAALVPYLLFEQRRHRHLSNPGLYAGLLAGIGLVGCWLWLSINQYGSDPVFGALFGKITLLGAEPYHSSDGPFYYFWNIPANAFPWPLFSLIGVWFCWQDRHQPNPYRWLLIYPFILFGMLTSFATRTPYYTLQLFPFMALFGAIALHRMATQAAHWPRRALSYAFAALGLILAMLGSAIAFIPRLISPSPDLADVLTEVQPYAPVAIVLGLGWCALPFTQRHPSNWLAAWLLPAWLGLGATGISGLMGDYTPELEADLAQPSVAAVIASEPIDFVTGIAWPDPEEHETFTLLSYYTPIIGNLIHTFDNLPANHYAWLAPNTDANALATAQPYDIIGEVQTWQLIKFLAK